MKKIRIGYCGRGKWEKFRWSEFVDYARTKNVIVDEIDLTKPIENQGEFDLIIHKMTYLMHGHDMNCDPELNRIYNYIKNHPEIIFVDDLDAVAVTLDREETDTLLKSINWNLSEKVGIPNSSHINKSDINSIKTATSNLQFPILAKPKIASSTSNSSTEESHMLRLATTPEQLVNFPAPAILQEYKNHGGVVYKVYTLGSKIECDLRPSTRDILPGETFNLDFHSQKPNENSEIWTQPRDLSHIKIPFEHLEKISSVLRKEMKMDCLGFDVLIDENEKFWIIDVNYFPGYKNIIDLWPKFLNFFLEKLGMPPR
ncbi:Inositol 1, 3, 4-trisphosphate 5/6-kinase family protein [Tritrichomonas foetus]|uniref:Inositol-tetrakisphosphate 1-kinase n=1 Tax=Tritrichomonas foetus TaxID=1144522 RepID=A0A1J4KA05_9EUKA|nr:Inositol 1, 3, 4-trisphosphate 5/6-kinase family protein [Tritrichomonas foetus]|eukprot:OHT06524.1 Inositol 1, 3, 4-trisphosphate 5/6-kinase family protein [Tritrichomonas foetus]